MPFSTEPGFILPGHRDDARHAEAALEHRALGGAERRHAAVGPSEDFCAVVGGEDDDGVVGDADVVEVLEQIADIIVHLRHAGFFEAVVALIVHLRLVLLRQIGEDVHARGVVPDEERLAGRLGLIHEPLRVLNQNFVEGLHVVFGVAALLPHLVIRAHVLERLQRTFVDDALLADLAPARHHGRIVSIGRLGMNQVARAVFVDPVLRVSNQYGSDIASR